MNMDLLFTADMVPEPKFVTKNDVAYQALEKSRLDDLPYVDAEHELELMFDKCQTKHRIRKEFDVPEFKSMYESSELPEWVTRAFCLDLCIQMVVHKRAEPGTLIGILWHHFESDRGRHVAMQECANALELCVDANFVDYSMSRKEFVVRLELTRETQQELDRYQYPLPMVVQPKPIKQNNQNGYISNETGRGLVVLKPGRMAPLYSQADLCLDHLNRMNSIPLTLNTQVAELIDNEWNDIDRRKPGETAEQYEKRVKAFERYDQASKDVMHALQGIRDRFWLTHKYDRRGRVYCQGYHVNYQGNPWNKAVIEFAEKEEIHDS